MNKNYRDSVITTLPFVEKYRPKKLDDVISHNTVTNTLQNFITNKTFPHLLLYGPPGTGKTTTLVNTVRLVLQTEKQVLVCAPTNTAVDLLCEKMNKIGLNVLRLGHPARISEDLLSTSVDGKVSQSIYYKDIKNCRD